MYENILFQNDSSDHNANAKCASVLHSQHLMHKYANISMFTLSAIL